MPKGLKPQAESSCAEELTLVVQTLSAQRLSVWCVVLLVCLAAPTSAQQLDLVLSGGRVMDPESGTDARLNVGIRAGGIAELSEEALEGKVEIDVSGLVGRPASSIFTPMVRIR